MTFSQAIEEAIARAMAEDERVIVFGEDVHLLRINLLTRFGPRRVMNAPISESAFLGAAVGAAMAGLRPIVEVMLIDFIGVCLDALLNQAAKVEAFSGGHWKVPMVVRASCGGGYGDAGQHEQCLWGLLAGIPGLAVVVPSNPADACGLMLASISSDSPVVFLEHKMLSDYWLSYLGSGGRENVSFDVPSDGAEGEVPFPLSAVPIGSAKVKRAGGDIAIATLGVGVHRALEAADKLCEQGIEAEVIDLRSVSPLDSEAIVFAAAKTKRILVVDEDYLGFGLSGEVAAIISSSGIQSSFARIGPLQAIPYARHLEDKVLPGADDIFRAALDLVRR